MSGAATTGWSEEDSRQFLAAADVVTPSRAEVMDLFAALAPLDAAATATVVELCAGGGDLGARLLDAFPAIRYVGYDGSAVMLERAHTRLQAHTARVELRPFRLEEASWRTALPADTALVVSSLAIHHLDGAGKRALYRDLWPRIRPGGALLVFDLVLPAAGAARAVAARMWDEVVRAQSLALTGSDSAYRAFQSERGNCFAHPDPADMPDSLYAQLGWLEEAGFRDVDAFWQRASHALFGGFRA